MARFVDVNKLIELYDRLAKDEWNQKTAPSSWAEAFECAIADIDDFATEDVAPKSEVANEVIDDIEMYVLGIKSGKEIIEKTTPKIYRLKRKDYMEAVLEYLAELKKKYTEERK